MNGFVVIPASMDRAMERDLDKLRDSLPEGEREAFDSEREVHRQTIIDYYAKYGTYPQIDGVQRNR